MLATTEYSLKCNTGHEGTQHATEYRRIYLDIADVLAITMDKANQNTGHQYGRSEGYSPSI